MGTLVRTTGFGSSSAGGQQAMPMGKRATFVLSDGTRVAIVADPNQVGIAGDGGDNTGVAKFYIYTSPFGTAWTLRATVTPTAAALNQRTTWCAAVGANNNIHIAWRTTAGGIAYRRVTFAAGPAYTVQAEETVLSGFPTNGNTGYVRRMDMDVAGSGDNAVIAAYCALTGSATLSNRRCELRVFTRTTTPSWVAAPTTIFISAGSWYYLGSEDVTCAADKAGPDGSNNITVMCAVTRKRNDGADLGAVLFRVATNTVTGTATVTFITPSSVGVNGFAFGNSGGQILLNLYSTANGEWTMMIGLAWNPPKIGVWRFTMSGSTKTDLIALQSFTWATSLLQRLDPWHWGAITFGDDSAVFLGVGGTGWVYGASIQFFRTPTHKVRYGIFYRWDQGYTFGGFGGMSLTGTSVGNRNLSLNVHGILMLGKNNWFKVEYKENDMPVAPAFVVPKANATITTDRPAVAAEHRWGVNIPQMRTKMQWQLATDSGFSTNLRDFIESDTDFVYAQNTASPTNARIPTTEAMPALAELFQGTWFIRARSVTEVDDLGAWSAGQAFVVSHPPNASDLFPKNDAIFSYGVSGAITFSWKFTDPSPFDLQTAYQIIVEDAITESIILDTGKIVSTLKTGTHNIPAAGKDIQLRWKIRLWDSDNVQGNDSAYSTFYVVDNPAVTVNYPSAATTNFLTSDDSTFEATIGTWQAITNAGTPTRSVAQAHSGTASGTVAATGAGTVVVGTANNIYPTYPGQELAIGGWSRGNTNGRVVRMVYKFYDETNTYMAGNDVQGNTVTDATGAWTQIPTKVAFAPNGAAWFRPCIQRDSMTAAETFFWDDMVGGDTGNISTGAPVVNWTFSVGGQRYQTHYRVVIFLNGVVIYDSGWILSDNNQHQIPLGYLQNLTTYTFRVLVKDNLNLESSGEQIASTSFVVPAAPVVTVSTAAFSQIGYVRLTWTNALEDPDFISYRVYRHITGASAFDLLTEITQQDTSYTYDDYLARSSVSYDYVVVQVVDRYQSTVESNYVITTVTPVSDTYWLVHPDDPTKTIILRSVTADDPEEEYEQETYTIIGRGRHVDYGDRLGWKGSLTAQLRDRSGVSARTQKLAILALKAELVDVYLKTPFGDIYRVAMGNVKVSRISGVSTNEFCNLEIPYEEVAE